MIRINLLQVKRKKKRAAVPPIVFGLILALILSGGAFAYMTHYLNAKIDAYTAEKSANDKEIEKLNKIIKDVDDFEANNRAFEQKRQAIEELQVNQSVPVRMMNELVTRVTPNVWVTSLDEKNKSITLNGEGYSNADIVALVDSLKASPMFKDVTLVQTKRSDEQGIDVYAYTITLRLVL